MRPPDLARAIGRGGLVALTVNCVVGAGILGLPGRVYALAGAATVPVLLAAALLAIAVALCLAELSSRFEGSGGPVEYLDQAFGSPFGFAAGWTIWTATVLSAASLLNLMAEIAAPGARAGVIIVTGAALTGATLAGAGRSTSVSTALMLLKLAVLAGIALAGFWAAPAPARAIVHAPRPLAAIVLLFFAFVGFERPTAVAGEVANPRHAVPFALIAGMAIVALLYLALFAVCLRGVPALATSTQPLSDLAGRILGPSGARAFNGAAAVIVLGTLLSQWITAPRLLLALAERGELPSRLARVARARRTPDAAIAVTAAAATLLALGGDFVGSVAASSASRLLVFLGCAAAMIRLRRLSHEPPRFRLPGGVVVATTVMAACGGLLVAAAGELSRMLVTVMIGGVLWWIMRWTRSRTRR